MPVHPKSPKENICHATQKQSEEPALETAEEAAWISAGMRAKSSTATSARTSDGTKNATSTSAIGKRTVGKLVVKEGQMVNSTAASRLYEGFFESDHSSFPQVASLNSTRSGPSSDDSMNFEEFFFDEQSRFALLSALT